VEPLLLRLPALARELKLPRDWLRAEAEAGRIPCLRVGRKLLFSPRAVEAALAERAARPKGGESCRR
jgi:hypothetical protein